MTPIELSVLGVMLLILAGAALAGAARAARVPYTSFLALFGLAAGFVATSFEGAGGALGQISSAWRMLSAPTEVILLILLPPLLFAAGLAIDVRRLLEDIWPVTILAVVAVIVCVGVVGVAAYWAGAGSLLVCLLLGAIVSTTDAAAVIGILRDIGAPRRLTLLLEGESLFNDAAAIALFTALIAVIGAGTAIDPWATAAAFGTKLLGGLALGFGLAKLALGVIRLCGGLALAEIAVTIVLAYLAYLLGEAYAGVSGIVAVVAAAIVFAVDGRTVLSPGTWGTLISTWRLLEFAGTALIFAVATMLLARSIGTISADEIGLAAVLFGATLVARAAVLFLFMPLASAVRAATPITMPAKIVITWGGLRGAVTVLLALAAHEAPEIADPETRQLLLVAASVYVIMTLFIQAPTLGLLINVLGLDKLTPVERGVRERVVALTRRAIDTQLSELLGTPPPDGADDGRSALSTDEEVKVALVVLATREREVYLDLYNRGITRRRTTDGLRAHAEQIIEEARACGVDGYLDAAYKGIAITRRFRLALALHRQFGIDRMLRDVMSERVEEILAKRVVLKVLRRFCEREIWPLFGAEARAAVQHVLDQRRDLLAQALESLRLQFPRHVDEREANFFDRVRLGLEQVEYRRQLEQSVISADLFADLEADRSRRARRAAHTNDFDLGIKLTRMLRRVDLFRELDRAALSAIARALRPVLAMPGETIVRAGPSGGRNPLRSTNMFFIVSGSVTVRLADRAIALGPGDYFGEIAVLSGGPRTADVVAEGYVHLLALSQRDFHRLSRRLDGFRAHVEATAARRSEAPASVPVDDLSYS